MRIFLVPLFVIIADQISKIFVKGLEIGSLGIKIKGMFPGQRIPVIKNFFNITFVENPGIAFGINFGSNFKFLVTLFTLVTCIGLVTFLYRSREKSLSFRISLALILGGAIGNLVDRVFYGVIYGYAPLFYGKVVDFCDFRLFSFYMFHKTLGNYIFNFADLSVTTGVILLFYALNKQRSTTVNSDHPIEEYLADNKE